MKKASLIILCGICFTLLNTSISSAYPLTDFGKVTKPALASPINLTTTEYYKNLNSYLNKINKNISKYKKSDAPDIRSGMSIKIVNVKKRVDEIYSNTINLNYSKIQNYEKKLIDAYLKDYETAYKNEILFYTKKVVEAAKTPVPKSGKSLASKEANYQARKNRKLKLWEVKKEHYGNYTSNVYFFNSNKIYITSLTKPMESDSISLSKSKFNSNTTTFNKIKARANSLLKRIRSESTPFTITTKMGTVNRLKFNTSSIVLPAYDPVDSPGKKPKFGPSPTAVIKKTLYICKVGKRYINSKRLKKHTIVKINKLESTKRAYKGKARKYKRIYSKDLYNYLQAKKRYNNARTEHEKSLIKDSLISTKSKYKTSHSKYIYYTEKVKKTSRAIKHLKKNGTKGNKKILKSLVKVYDGSHKKVKKEMRKQCKEVIKYT